MRLFHKLTCLVRGHVPLESLPTEPPPPRKLNLHTITGISILNGSLGPSVVTTTGQHTQIAAGAGRGMSVRENGPVMQIDYPGASCKLSVCARCAGVYWHSAPNLPALTSSENVPLLAELHAWNKRESWEREQRQSNEAAARLYKQYQMVLKLACDEVDE